MRPADSAVCIVGAHVWVRSVLEDARRIGSRAQRRLAQAAIALVPVICRWEVALLIASGRLNVDDPATAWIEAALGPITRVRSTRELVVRFPACRRPVGACARLIVF